MISESHEILIRLHQILNQTSLNKIIYLTRWNHWKSLRLIMINPRMSDPFWISCFSGCKSWPHVTGKRSLCLISDTAESRQVRWYARDYSKPSRTCGLCARILGDEPVMQNPWFMFSNMNSDKQIQLEFSWFNFFALKRFYAKDH